MDSTDQNAVVTTCRQCATLPDAGRIFCAKCGAALKTPSPLIPSILDLGDAKAQRRHSLTGRGVLLVFSICTLADFVWALLEKRSLAEAAISAVLGLFGTAWYLLIYWAAGKNDPDDPNWPARMVP